MQLTSIKTIKDIEVSIGEVGLWLTNYKVAKYTSTISSGVAGKTVLSEIIIDKS